jgi:hypothetical protein
MRAELSWATGFPRRVYDTVTAMVRVHRARGLHFVLLIQNDFVVHREMARRESWTRIVEVSGATVTALSGVEGVELPPWNSTVPRITTGFCREFLAKAMVPKIEGGGDTRIL